MSALRSIKVRATDASHLELLLPLEHMPSGEFDILIPDEDAAAGSATARAAAFKSWAGRPRPRVGLADAGRDAIYVD